MRTCGLSHQIKGPTTVKLAKTGLNCKIVKFTITGPLIWCDNPQVRMSKILYINNNNFHNLGRSQMCAGGCCYFRPSKPHSGTLCPELILWPAKFFFPHLPYLILFICQLRTTPPINFIHVTSYNPFVLMLCCAVLRGEVVQLYSYIRYPPSQIISSTIIKITL